MRALWLLLRLYSYLVLSLTALAAVAMSAVIVASPHHTVRVGWLPWTGEALGAWLAGIGVFGIAAIVCALAGRMRGLLSLYCSVILWLLFRGLFVSSWQFAGPSQFRLGIAVMAGLLLALIGTVPLPKPDRPNS